MTSSLKNAIVRCLVIAAAGMLFTFFLMPALNMPVIRLSERVRRTICQEQLHQLGSALTNYSNKFDGRLPNPDKWCDLLIEQVGLSPLSLTCIRPLGESAFALNRYVAGMSFSDIDADVVVLFESDGAHGETAGYMRLIDREFAKSYSFGEYPDPYKAKIRVDRLNQIGGPELLTLAHHRDEGCNVLLADGTVRWIGIDQLARLKWTNDGSVELPSNLAQVVQKRLPIVQNNKRMLPFIFLIPLFATAIIIWTCRRAACFTFAVSLACLSAILGALGGYFAQRFYAPPTSWITGTTAGAFFGFLCGLAYVYLLLGILSVSKTADRTYRWTFDLAMLTGATCSTLVHAALILTTNITTEYAVMLAALPFGIIAGVILGSITAAVLARKRNICTQRPSIEDDISSAPKENNL